MKWTTLTSIFFCAANFITSLAVLIITSYNIKLTSSKDYRLPLPGLDTWRNYLTHLIPTMIYIITTSVLSCWGVTRKRKPFCAMMVMLLHAVALTLCVVYCNLISSAITNVSITATEMKNNTMQIYRDYIKHHEWDTKWIPLWLSDIQDQSSQCCGIVGYEDWKEFWPENPTEIPESCCIKEINKCINNLDHIEWPETAANYLKTKEGCSGLINEAMKERMTKTIQLLILLSALLGFALASFALQYSQEFCAQPDNSDKTEANDSAANLTIGETWARMGFGRCRKVSKGKKKEKLNKILDDSPDLNFDVLPAPGSYTDFYLKQLNQSQDIVQNDSSNNQEATSSSNSNLLPETATSDTVLSPSKASLDTEATQKKAAKNILQQLRFQSRSYYGKKPDKY